MDFRFYRNMPMCNLGPVFKKIVGHFRSLLSKLMDLHDTPHSLAGGVAIGMFLGFSPLFGLKTLLAVGLAWLFRCNPIAAVISVSLHDIVAPVWPVMLEVEYLIGEWILGFFGVAPQAADPAHFEIHEIMKWTTFFHIGLPMLLGSLFLSVPAAFISFKATLPIFARREEKRRLAAMEAGK